MSRIPDELPSEMSTELIHRVLLTDPAQTSMLTCSGRPRSSSTLSFGEFESTLSSSQMNANNLNINHLVKGAYRDQICQGILESSSWQTAQNLLNELHAALRRLVPSRPDLHQHVKDERVEAATTLATLHACLVEAAQALAQLESEARSETTVQWLNDDDVARQRREMNEILCRDNVDYVVTSLLYLHYKADLCYNDMQDFYLVNLWAPRLWKDGPALLRDRFVASYGSFSNNATAPATRAWIAELVVREASEQQQGLLALAAASDYSLRVVSQRQALVFRGWIETILFRSASAKPLALPEIFASDADRLVHLRRVARLAAAGSALALHAAQVAAAAGQPSTTTSRLPRGSQTLAATTTTTVDPDAVERGRTALVHAMQHQQQQSQAQYEASVAAAVLALARVYTADDLDEAAVGQTLVSTTRNVMLAQDSVVQLLDRRMKEAFVELVLVRAPTTTDATVPLTLQAGKSLAAGMSLPVATARNAFLREATQLFGRRGLAFYASDLALAAQTARKIVQVAWDVYGSVFLDPTIAIVAQQAVDAHQVTNSE